MRIVIMKLKQIVLVSEFCLIFNIELSLTCFGLIIVDGQNFLSRYDRFLALWLNFPSTVKELIEKLGALSYRVSCLRYTIFGSEVCNILPFKLVISALFNKNVIQCGSLPYFFGSYLEYKRHVVP